MPSTPPTDAALFASTLASLAWKSLMKASISSEDFCADFICVLQCVTWPRRSITRYCSIGSACTTALPLTQTPQHARST